ncbi:MAG: hypothetical protein WBZ48_01910 [Bacteroidota bacterium]
MIMKFRPVIIPLYLIVSNICFGQFHQGTAVFAYCFHDAIVIGADSKFTTFGKKNELSGVGYGCKVFRGNDSVYFAISGNAIPVIDGENIIARDARHACENGTSLSAIASLFKVQAINSLEPYVGAIQRLVAGGVRGDYVSVAFFGFEEGIASSYILKFHDINILKLQDTTLITGKESKVGKYPLKVQLGNASDIDKFLSAHPAYLGHGRDSITVEINNLIGLEILAHPDAVGGGISILCIYPHKHEWWQGGCECKSF